jgi:hypothetical protein
LDERVEESFDATLTSSPLNDDVPTFEETVAFVMGTLDDEEISQELDGLPLILGNPTGSDQTRYQCF